MKKIKEFQEKYLNQKVRNIISVFIILAGTIFMYYYCLLSPTIINKYIASNIYKAPANTYFDDQNFYNCVVDAYNSENNTSLPYTTNLSDSQLGSIKSVSCNNKGISSTKGLEKLTSLTSLNIYNNNLTELDINKNTALIELDVHNNHLKTLDISKNTKLTRLQAKDNELETINIERVITLTELNVSYNSLTALDISKNTALISLDIRYNNLTELDVSNNTKLTGLNTIFNELTELDVSKNTSLYNLDVSHNKLIKIDVSNNTKLTSLGVSENDITELDISKNIALTDLYVEDTKLTTLNISKNPALTDLWARSNDLIELDVSKNTKLTQLLVERNKLEKLNISGADELTTLNAQYNNLTSLDVSNNIKLGGLSVDGNNLTELDISKNINLKGLFTSSNNLTSLDVSKNTNLTTLDVSSNNLTVLDINKNTKLSNLKVNNNKLTDLNVSKNTKLTELNVNNNYLTTLDISKNTDLTSLSVIGNYLTTLDVSKNTALTNLSVGDIKYRYTAGEVKYDDFVLPEIKFASNSKMNLDNLEGSAKGCKKNGTGISVCNNNIIYYLNSKKYDISGDNILVSYLSDDTIIENIDISYKGYDTAYVDDSYKILTKEVKNDKLIIKNKYKNETIKEFNLIGYSSDKYDLSKNEITYANSLDLSDIKCNGCIASVNNNKLIIKYNDKIIKEFDLVKLEVTSDKYDLNKDNIIYINNFDINKINVSDGVTKEFIDNKLIIKYKDSVVGSYNLLKINTEYKASKNTIFTKGDSDDVILTKITSDDVDLSIANDELIIKYNNEEIKRYTLSDIDESFDVKDYNVNDDKYIISGIKIGTKINDFTSKIDTNVSYDIIDTSGNVMTNEILKTGYKIRLAFSVEPMEYVLSIKGDVLGTGTITIDGAKFIARHIIDGNVIKGNAYLDAADYNSDGVIKMNDVVRMLKENK